MEARTVNNLPLISAAGVFAGLERRLLFTALSYGSGRCAVLADNYADPLPLHLRTHGTGGSHADLLDEYGAVAISAFQLAPITPVPKIAMRRSGFGLGHFISPMFGRT